METITIPKADYYRLTAELDLLKNSALLNKVNRLIDMLYQDKYGLYLGDYTEDLSEDSINKAWGEHESAWDNV